MDDDRFIELIVFLWGLFLGIIAVLSFLMLLS